MGTNQFTWSQAATCYATLSGWSSGHVSNEWHFCNVTCHVSHAMSTPSSPMMPHLSFRRCHFIMRFDVSRCSIVHVGHLANQWKCLTHYLKCNKKHVPNSSQSRNRHHVGDAPAWCLGKASAVWRLSRPMMPSLSFTRCHFIMRFSVPRCSMVHVGHLANQWKCITYHLKCNKKHVPDSSQSGIATSTAPISVVFRRGERRLTTVARGPVRCCGRKNLWSILLLNICMYNWSK